MPSNRKTSGVDLSMAGRWVFLIGVVVAALGGLIVARPETTQQIQQGLLYLIIVLGLVGGYLFISKEDEHHFILLVIGLAIFAQPFSAIPGDVMGTTVGNFVYSMLQYEGLFLGIAVVAIVIRNIISWFKS